MTTAADENFRYETGGTCYGTEPNEHITGCRETTSYTFDHGLGGPLFTDEFDIGFRHLDGAAHLADELCDANAGAVKHEPPLAVGDMADCWKLKDPAAEASFN